MATIEDKAASVFSRIITTPVQDDLTFVTVHLIVKDNRKCFFFVDNEAEQNDGLKYKVIDFNTIVVTNYPTELKEEDTVPFLPFYFSTDETPTTEYKNFELYIQFYTKKVVPNTIALKYHGKRGYMEKNGQLDEVETEYGTVFFPDIEISSN